MSVNLPDRSCHHSIAAWQRRHVPLRRYFQPSAESVAESVGWFMFAWSLFFAAARLIYFGFDLCGVGLTVTGDA